MFGENSDLDPAVLFKMLPSLDGFIDNIQKDFRESVGENFRLLFSNGTAGPGSFVDGCFKLLSNLGLKVEKALALRFYFVKMLEMAFPQPYQWQPSGSQMSTSPAVADYKLFFEQFFQALQNVSEEYKVVYPKSEFPEIVWKLAGFINSSSNSPPYYNCYSMFNNEPYYNYNATKVSECYTKQDEAYREFSRKSFNDGLGLSIDIQFAIFNEIDFSNLDLYEVSEKFVLYKLSTRCRLRGQVSEWRQIATGIIGTSLAIHSKQ